MSIKTGSATFTRFFIPYPITEGFGAYVDEKLQSGIFKGIEDSEELAVGFTSWEDFFDSTIPYGSYHNGEYVAFHFRTDRRKVPSIVLKQHVRTAVQKYRNENEGRGPSKASGCRSNLRITMKTILAGSSLNECIFLKKFVRFLTSCTGSFFQRG